jgi:hypothetical protein
MKNWTPVKDLHPSLANNINFLELVAACVPVLAWAPLLRGAKVTIESDNSSTVSFIKRGTTKNPEALVWLKRIFQASLEHDFHLSARHVPGVDNTCPDALSRLTLDAKYAAVFADNFGYSVDAQDNFSLVNFRNAEDPGAPDSTVRAHSVIDGPNVSTHSPVPMENLP